VTEEDLNEIECANQVRALEREVTRLCAHVVNSAAGLIDAGVAIAEMYGETDEQRAHIRSTIGAAVDALVDGLYPQAGEERDE
jgi:hypothetical protein